MSRIAPASKCVAVLLAALPILAFAGNALAQDADSDIMLETKIVSATLYGHQAQVVRSGSVDLAVGEFRITCDDLPEGIIETSLIVEGAGSANAKIVGIDFERREMEYEGTPRYQELTAELERLTAERSEFAVQRGAIERRNTLTRSVGEFSAARGKEDIGTGTFSTQQWRGLMQFIEEETFSGELRLRDVKAKSDDVSQEMRRVEEEMRRIRGEGSSGKDLVIDCEVASAGDLEIELTYIVGGATWRPEYTVRYIEALDEVELTYAARISQSTGEDWDGVNVLLSTASPHVGASPPTLFPHVLGAVSGGVNGTVTDATTGAPLAYANISAVGTPYGGMTNRDGYYEIPRMQSGSYTVQASFMGYESTRRVNVRVIAGVSKRLDIVLQPIVIRGGEVMVEAERPMVADGSRIRPINTVESAIATQPGVVLHDGDIHVRGGRSSEVKTYAEGQAVSYAEMTVAGSEFAANLVIAKPVNLESGAEPRRVLVVQRRIPGTFVRESIPRYSDHVFVRGMLENPLDVPILSGPAEVYVESAPARGGPAVTNFVGKDTISDVAPGEEFTMYLGADQSLKVEQDIGREVLSRSGDKKTKIRYTVSITSESFREAPVELWILDRVPISTLKDVEVKDIEILPEPDVQDDEGLLTWKLTLGAGEKTEIEAGYTVEFSSEYSARGINLE